MAFELSKVSRVVQVELLGLVSILTEDGTPASMLGLLPVLVLAFQRIMILSYLTGAEPRSRENPVEVDEDIVDTVAIFESITVDAALERATLAMAVALLLFVPVTVSPFARLVVALLVDGVASDLLNIGS